MTKRENHYRLREPLFAGLEDLERRQLMSATVESVLKVDIPTGATVLEVARTNNPAGQTSSTESATAFPVYEYIKLPGSPDDLSAYNLKPISFIVGELWYGQATRNMPNEANVRAMANRVADLGEMAVINIEDWPVDLRSSSRVEVLSTMTKFAQIIDWAKDERPDLQIGIYGQVPLRDFWAPVNYFNAVSGAAEVDALNLDNYAWHKGMQAGWWRHQPSVKRPGFDAWQAANDFLRPLAEKVDVIFPSLYTFYADSPSERQKWQWYAEANIAEASQYGKPVIPVLWSEYHDSNPTVGDTFLPADFLQFQLDIVRNNADGMVMWSNYTGNFNPTDPWFQTLSTFARDNLGTGTKPLPTPTVPPVVERPTRNVRVGQDVRVVWSDLDVKETTFQVSKDVHLVQFALP